MSLKYRDNNGTETPVAGLNGTSGELVPSVSVIRSGTYTPSSSVQVQEDLSFSVTFSEPMPDNDYQVIFGSFSNDTASGTIQCVVRSRSTTGFAGVIRNVGTSEISAASGRFTWFAFKLMTDEVHEADATAIAQNTANFAPTFSETTSYAVGDYCTYNGILYRCTTAHTAGVWVAGHFTQVTVGGQLSNFGTFGKALKLNTANWISDDFNNAVPSDGSSVQVFTVLNSAAHTPRTGANYIVIAMAFARDYIQQEAIQNGTNARYIRYLENDTWSAWERLITSQGSIGYSTGLSGATYTTLSEFLTALIAEVHATVTLISGVMPFGGVWSGKSLFTGVYFKQDSTTGSFQIEFQNPQDDKVFYHGYLADGAITFTAIA